MKILGVNKLINAMNLSIMKVTGDMEKIAERGGRIIERRAKENITGKHGHQRHIITGNLRRSITTRAQKITGTVVRVSIGTDVYYATAVEARDKTGGYLRPALFESEQDALIHMQNIISGAIL